MPTKRRVLELLTRPELQSLVGRYELLVVDHRVREQLVDAAVSSRKVTLGDALADYSRDRLKELCRELDLDDGGREKALLVGRIAGEGAPSSALDPAAARSDGAHPSNVTARARHCTSISRP